MIDRPETMLSPDAGEGHRSWLDVTLGVAFGVGGAGLFHAARGFTPMLPNSLVGPGLLPSICAIVFMIFGAALALSGFRRRSATVGEAQPAGWLPFNIVMIGGLVAVVFAMPVGGFILTTTVFTFIAIWISGARWWGALIAALVTSLGVYYLFYGLLRVPLPAGSLF